MGLSGEQKKWFGRVFHDERGRPKMSLSDLADAAGVARSTIYRLKDGTGETDQEKMAQVAKALGVPVPEIVVTLRDTLPEPTLFDQLREARQLIESAEARLASTISVAQGLAPAEELRPGEERDSTLLAKEVDRRRPPDPTHSAEGQGAGKRRRKGA